MSHNQRDKTVIRPKTCPNLRPCCGVCSKPDCIDKQLATSDSSSSPFSKGLAGEIADGKHSVVLLERGTPQKVAHPAGWGDVWQA